MLLPFVLRAVRVCIADDYYILPLFIFHVAIFTVAILLVVYSSYPSASLNDCHCFVFVLFESNKCNRCSEYDSMSIIANIECKNTSIKPSQSAIQPCSQNYCWHKSILNCSFWFNRMQAAKWIDKYIWKLAMNEHWALALFTFSPDKRAQKKRTTEERKCYAMHNAHLHIYTLQTNSLKIDTLLRFEA